MKSSTLSLLLCFAVAGPAFSKPDRAPDLTLKAETAWELPAEGGRTLHTFVIPSSALEGPRFVEAIQLRPGSIGYIRHGVVRSDTTDDSRLLDAESAVIGIPGRPILSTLNRPNGVFAVWTPAAPISEAPAGTAWRIHPYTDLVVTLHLFPDGQTHSIQPEIDLWFAETEPTQQLLNLRLAKETIELSPGESRMIGDSWIAPAPFWVNAVYFDANERATKFRLEFLAPEAIGARLARADAWNPGSESHQFQQLPERRRIPASARFDLKVSYENTAAQGENPPREIRHGFTVADEICEAHIRIIAHNSPTAMRLTESISLHQLNLEIEANEAEIERNGGRVRTHSRLALLYSDLGEHEAAMDEGRKAVELGLENPEAHAALAGAYLANGFTFSAQEHAEKAIELDQFNASGWFNLGIVFLEYGFPVRALNCFENARQEEPRNLRFLNNLSSLLIHEKRYEEAQKHLEVLLMIEPRHAKATANLGRIHEMTADPEKAIELYRRALEIAPEMSISIGPRLEKLTGVRPPELAP
ncbi:MAG: tetratricopeptide (TPR) repeat protein [Verrucomicrobiales bacterium]|jgi:tetratricopeptide (TPR) repeat protein